VTLRGIATFLLVCLAFALASEVFWLVLGDEDLTVAHVAGTTLLLSTIGAGVIARDFIKSRLLLFLVRAVGLAVMLGFVVAELYGDAPAEVAIWSSPFAAALIGLFEAVEDRQERRKKQASRPASHA
jgi:hypothetical protein